MPAVKPISSYPFLDLAKKYEVPYELTLAMGDMYIHQRAPSRSVEATAEQEEKLTAMTAEIVMASTNFLDIVKHGWDQS